MNEGKGGERGWSNASSQMRRQIRRVHTLKMHLRRLHENNKNIIFNNNCSNIFINIFFSHVLWLLAISISSDPFSPKCPLPCAKTSFFWMVPQYVPTPPPHIRADWRIKPQPSQTFSIIVWAHLLSTTLPSFCSFFVWSFLIKIFEFLLGNTIKRCPFSKYSLFSLEIRVAIKLQPTFLHPSHRVLEQNPPGNRSSATGAALGWLIAPFPLLPFRSPNFYPPFPPFPFPCFDSPHCPQHSLPTFLAPLR